jgi:hypothetical protein
MEVRKIITWISLIFVSTVLLAQDVDDNFIGNVPLGSIEIQPNESVEKNVEISNFSIESSIYGNLAETTLDISFLNPNNRTLSADFIFPIPTNSVINGYALDVNGVMVDGVVVEKQKARVVFEKIVRQGIDPGLVEKVEGNVFKTRIFPIESDQIRSIQIKYVTVLSQNNADLSYQIPLLNKQMVKKFTLSIKAHNLDSKPILLNKSLEKLDFKKWNNVYTADFEGSNFQLDKAITLQVPNLSKNISIIGKNSTDDYFFSIKPIIKGALVNQIKSNGNKPVKIKQIICEASHSRPPVNTETDLE